jgi:cytochrome c peroxidase
MFGVRRRFFGLGSVLLTLIISASVFSADAKHDFSLRTTCPPGFELVDDHRCELRTLYQFYDSTQNAGVGGTQTGLPPHRDGFSPQQIDLGRYLFFDPILSADKTISCASCHQPDKGFADGQAVSIGADGQATTRSAPSLWNSAFSLRLFWDGRTIGLENQALGPLYAANEMANTPEQLLMDLTQNTTYRRLFNDAFPESNGLTLAQVYTALAAFQSSLISLNSRYDQYAHGNHAALVENEIAGLNIFRSFVARCAECHTPPLFTNNQIAVIGTPEPEGKPFDVGALVTFEDEKMRGAFKVPTLRNIAKTAPYMHSGRFATLREAAEFYTKGRGHAVPEGMNLHIHWHIWEPKLSSHELDLLVEFLGTLTDQAFMPEIPARLPSGLTGFNAEGNLHTQLK